MRTLERCGSGAVRGGVAPAPPHAESGGGRGAGAAADPASGDRGRHLDG